MLIKEFEVKPTWQTADGSIRLYLGDCLDILPSITPGTVNIITDPPYGIGEAAGKNASRGNLAVAKDYGNARWDDEPAVKEVAAARLVSKWQIIFGGNYFELPPSSCWLVWDKLNGTNDFADCELAWTNLRKAVRRLQFRWNGMIRDEACERIHPTQKPVGVMQWALSHLPDDSRDILDPMMGSGTTGIACMRAGRSFIGIECDTGHFWGAVERFKREESRAPLFEKPPVIQRNFTEV